SRADRLAADLSVPRLASAWQMLLKGLEEAARAPRPFAAAEMLIIRMCYTAQLPSPADIIGELRANAGAAGGGSARPQMSSSAPRGSASAAAGPPEAVAGQPGADNKASFGSFEDLAAHAALLRDIKLQLALEEQVELVKFRPGLVELHLLDGAPSNLAQELTRKLQAWTGERWVVSLSEERGMAPLGTRRRQEEARALEEIAKHPAVKSVMLHFPNAEIKRVRALESHKLNGGANAGPDVANEAGTRAPDQDDRNAGRA
ncbi:MAG TPA: hypothetical protein VE986_04120, partial [Hyphomicrobiales bacterium]|nr:hypothetical protein [Hyphomicrobiales bacterium]